MQTEFAHTEILTSGIRTDIRVESDREYTHARMRIFTLEQNTFPFQERSKSYL